MDKSNWALIATTLITVAGTIAVAVINKPGAARPQTEARERTPVSPTLPQTTPLAPSPASSIDGEWRDQFDARFTMASVGDRVTLRGTAGTKSMQGTGTLVGPRLRVAITNSVDAGTIRCDGTLVTPASIRSDCVEPNGNRFGWQLYRLF